jgi:hypothetical protein
VNQPIHYYEVRKIGHRWAVYHYVLDTSTNYRRSGWFPTQARAERSAKRFAARFGGHPVLAVNTL